MLSVNSSFYLFGGYLDKTHESKIGRFDLSTKAWAEAGVLNQGKARHAVALIDMSFVVVGSWGHVGIAKTEKCTLVRVFLWHRSESY